jgi:hypothetical protein
MLYAGSDGRVLERISLGIATSVGDFHDSPRKYDSAHYTYQYLPSKMSTPQHKETQMSNAGNLFIKAHKILIQQHNDWR